MFCSMFDKIYKDCYKSQIVYANIITLSPLSIYIECSTLNFDNLEKEKYGFIKTIGHPIYKLFNLSDIYASTMGGGLSVNFTKIKANNFSFVLRDDTKNMFINESKIFEDEVIHTKNLFSCLKLDPTFQYVMYVSDKTIKESKTMMEVAQSKEFLFQENYGEKLYNVVNPIIYVYSPFENTKKIVELPNNIAPAFVNWYPKIIKSVDGLDIHGIFFVAYEKEPFKTGITYISSRKNTLCYLDLDLSQNDINLKPINFIELAKGSIRFPTFDEAGKFLFYSNDRDDGPHHTSSQIWVIDWESKTRTVILDWSPKTYYCLSPHSKIQEPSPFTRDFPGFYMYTETFDMPGQNYFSIIKSNGGKCVGADKYHLLFTSYVRTNAKIYALLSLDLEITRKNNGKISYTPVCLTPDESGVWLLLDFSGDIAVASFSTLSKPPRLRYTRCDLDNIAIGLDNNAQGLVWHDFYPDNHEVSISSNLATNNRLICTSKIELAKELSKVFWEVLELDRKTTFDLKNEKFECIYMYGENGNMPTACQSPGLVVMPHGGPHSQWVNGWNHLLICLCHLGYDLLLVNYVGSSGYGDDFIYEILGRVGTLEILEIHSATTQTLALKSGSRITNQTPVYVLGGSYGGFSALHLAGQFPDFYRAIIVRNPVCDFSLLLALTDIPDYVYTEMGISNLTLNDEKLDSSGLDADEKFIIALYRASPIRYISKIKSPILFLLGNKDIRVPWAQSLRFYRMLKKANKKTCLYLYPDNHSLESPKVHFDTFVRMAEWLKSN